MKKNLPIFIVLLLVVGAGSFYGGMKYGQNKRTFGFTNSGKGMPGNFVNLSPEEHQARFQQPGAAGMPADQRGIRTGGGFITGEILSKDDKSITVKLGHGGSKIVFFSDATQITKSTPGLASDLTIGGQITISGEPNSDGSLTAKVIQKISDSNQ